MAQASQASHALVFRIMRLARPSLSPEDPLRFHLEQDLVADSLASPQLASALPASSHPFAGRVQLGEPGSRGLGGALALPQSFGLVHLGETFQAYVTVCNYSDQPVGNVAVKVELQTESSRAVLYDNTPTPVPLLAPGQRHDFIIKHDVKEPGAHTLACSSVYTAPDSERKYLPQHFRFSSANPMVVRTRHRLVGGSVFLEATLENAAKGPIVMELVTFQPAPPYTATRLDVQPAAAGGAGGAGSDGPLREYLHSVPIVPEGGSLSYLFQLTKPPSAGPQGGSPGAAGGLGASPRTPTATAVGLGRLEMRWRGHMGQPARLQTQTITMPAPPTRELSLTLARLPPAVVAERPFLLELRVDNATDRRLGPLKISFDGGSSSSSSVSGVEEGGLASAGGFAADGPQSVLLESVPPRGAATAALRLVALAPGPHALLGVVLAGERDGRQYDVLPRQDVSVLPAGT